MRKSYLLLAFIPAAIVWACGGDDSLPPDGGQDATTDSPSGDAAKNDGSTDGSSTDGSNSDGATDAGNDVTLTVDCLKPANCVDGGDQDAAYPPGDAGVVCCGTISLSGNFPNCNLDGANSACKAPTACATTFQFSCSTDQVRLCSTSAECTEGAYNVCCSAQAGDAGTVHFCANTTIAGASGGRITCN